MTNMKTLQKKKYVAAYLDTVVTDGKKVGGFRRRYVLRKLDEKERTWCLSAPALLYVHMIQ